MKLVFSLFLVMIIGVQVAYSQKPKKLKFKNNIDTVSYIIGTNIGQMLGKDLAELNLNQDLLVAGLLAAYNKDSALFTDAQKQTILMAFSKQLEAKKATEASTKNVKAKEDGLKFLAENKKKAGVISTASGLQYKVIKEGTGAKPALTDKVTVNYIGKLVDGSIFDQSKDQPITFPLNAVIVGWQEGLQLMTEGSTYEFYIPSELGYGSSGAAGVIPPDAVLIFEVQLIKIEK